MFDNIEWLWKTWGSGDGDCPSIMKVDGGYVLVGKNLDSGTIEQVAAVGRANNSGIGADETAVFLPADVIDRLRELG
ncbi:lipid A biosynthesis lauroyl acyltransferase [Actinoplanes sp. NPDC051513]|uniref:lipid A biosynthesis lauroyl acyltransferase n=1 Tax=Actinoplanes sp. NPDC051513 TaxID=3363908 RepID=UPI00379C769D